MHGATTTSATWGVSTDVLCDDHAEADVQSADEVLGAVDDGAGPEQYLLERALDADLDSRAARQVGVGVGHAPVVALARRLFGLGERECRS